MRGALGVGYVLPMLIETNLLVNHKGKIRLDIEKEFQWTWYLNADVEVTMREDQDTEFEFTLMFANRWEWSMGLMLTEDEVGFGGAI